MILDCVICNEHVEHSMRFLEGCPLCARCYAVAMRDEAHVSQTREEQVRKAMQAVLVARFPSLANIAKP